MMARRPYYQQTAVLLIGGVLLFCIDQLTKWAVRTWRGGVCNDAAALSIAAPSLVLGVVSVAVIMALSIWWYRHEAHQHRERIALVLIISGGASNTLDRLVRGCVTDFLDFFALWHFNIADAAIALGAALFLWTLFSSRHE